MVKIIVLLLSLAFISPSYGATIYHWVDKNGVANFTDDYEKLPSEYRNQIHKCQFFARPWAPAYWPLSYG